MAVQIANAVIVQDGKVLLVQQRKRSAYGLWSLPGGHVEEGETLEQAVVREVEEEVGVQLVNPRFSKTYRIEYQGETLDLHAFIGSITGTIQIKEDEIIAFGWFTIDELLVKNDLRHPYVLHQVQDALAILAKEA